MEAFEKMMARLTVIRGLSGRCTGAGHSVHGGALGLYRTSDAGRSPANQTIGEMPSDKAQKFPTKDEAR